MKRDDGARRSLLATRVRGICARSAARNRMSLMTLGQASASTQICTLGARECPVPSVPPAELAVIPADDLPGDDLEHHALGGALGGARGRRPTAATLGHGREDRLHGLGAL